MAQTTRRHFVETLLSAPIVGRLADLTRPSPEADKLVLMVQTCRLVNTVELWYKLDHGRYGTKAELLNSEAMASLKNSSIAERRGIGKSLLASISLASNEVIPECELHLSVRDEAKRYLL